MKKKRSRTGFSLLEVMAGVAIFGIALLGMLALMAQSLAMGQFANNRIIAINEARKALEDVRNSVDAFGVASVNCAQSTGGTALSNETIEISCPGGLGGDPLRVQAKVSWTERKKSVSYIVDTMMTRR